MLAGRDPRLLRFEPTPSSHTPLTSSRRPTTSAILPSRLGRYQVLRLLGNGGMGQVLLAREETAERTVALKRLRPEYAHDGRFVELFLREARLTALLSHENIVRLFALDEHEGEPFLVLEHVDGPDLTHVLTRLSGTRPPPGFGAHLVRELCRALAHVHALRAPDGRPLHLQHGDVSPSNLMLRLDGAVKLLDFGIAHGPGERALAAPFGKARYLAPERLCPQPTDERADLFSAGVVLFEALTAQRLFNGPRRVPAPELPEPSSLNPLVPPALDEICRRALAFDPGARFESAAAMSAALDEVLAAQPFHARDAAQLVSTLFTHAPPSASPRACDSPPPLTPLDRDTLE